MSTSPRDDLDTILSDLRSKHDAESAKHLKRYYRLEKARNYDGADQAYAAYKHSRALAEAHQHALMILRDEPAPTYYDERGVFRSMADLVTWQQAHAAGQTLLEEMLSSVPKEKKTKKSPKLTGRW